MGIPAGQKVIDLLLSIPAASTEAWYEPFKQLLMDHESKAMMKMPAQHLFKDLPDLPKEASAQERVDWTLAHMDRFNIERAFVGFDETGETTQIAMRDHADRFIFNIGVNPNEGMDAVRKIRRARQEFGVTAINVFPAGLCPQVPIDDKKMYPIYTACVEEGMPVFINVGVPGPRLPGACQDVRLLDEVCWFFPDLKVVMRHGAEPDEAMAVKLMLKYPNLYYSTSAFAPKHYPKAIIDFMNKRGADKVMYAGYFPMGLTLDRIFAELEELPLRDEVWPKFLHDNAAKLFEIA